MDLSTLTVAQLNDLLQKIPAEIKRRAAKEKNEVLKELKKVAERHGYSLDQLLGKEVKSKVRGPKSGGTVAVKYRHPQDGSQQWTGRGRQPKLVQAWLAGGGKIDQLKV